MTKLLAALTFSLATCAVFAPASARADESPQMPNMSTQQPFTIDCAVSAADPICQQKAFCSQNLKLEECQDYCSYFPTESVCAPAPDSVNADWWIRWPWYRHIRRGFCYYHPYNWRCRY